MELITSIERANQGELALFQGGKKCLGFFRFEKKLNDLGIDSGKQRSAPQKALLDWLEARGADTNLLERWWTVFQDPILSDLVERARVAMMSLINLVKGMAGATSTTTSDIGTMRLPRERFTTMAVTTGCGTSPRKVAMRSSKCPMRTPSTSATGLPRSSLT